MNIFQQVRSKEHDENVEWLLTPEDDEADVDFVDDDVDFVDADEKEEEQENQEEEKDEELILPEKFWNMYTHE